MKAVTLKNVYLKYHAIDRNEEAKIIKLPFYSLVFANGHFCGKIRTSVIKNLFMTY